LAAPVGRPLDPRRIEAEIARVREREAGGFGGGTKANLFNLVVAIPGGASGPVPDDALEVLLGRRPARIIRLAGGVTVPASPAPAAGATVSGRCYPGTLDRGVCLEEIDLAAGGDPLGDGVGTWAPLLARDIPTFLWIAGAWTPADLPREAGAQVDKLIVDGSRCDDPVGALPALHRLREATRRRLAVADLAWSRTLPLRVQAARAFDPPAARDGLERITTVRLAGATGAEALLFFLWLATRLQWRAPTATRGGVWRFVDAGGGTVDAVHEEPAPLGRGVRLSFVLRGATGVELSCSEDGCALIGEDRGPWRVSDDGGLLLAEVDSPRQDPLLAAALAMAAGTGPDAAERHVRHA
jgi:hypothetical protein